MSRTVGEESAAVQAPRAPRPTAVTAGTLPHPPARDRDNPTIADVLLHDPTQPLSSEVRTLLARDLTRWSHRALLPLTRAFSLVTVALIRGLKRVLPFPFASHRAIDVLCLWFMRRYMSADAAELLVRHFVVETNLLAFIAKNCGAGIPAPQLRPTTLAEIGQGNAVIAHDLAVYNLVIDVGRSGADLGSV